MPRGIKGSSPPGSPYRQRIASGLRRGLTPSQAAGKPHKGEPSATQVKTTNQNLPKVKTEKYSAFEHKIYAPIYEENLVKGLNRVYGIYRNNSRFSAWGVQIWIRSEAVPTLHPVSVPTLSNTSGADEMLRNVYDYIYDLLERRYEAVEIDHFQITVYLRNK